MNEELNPYNVKVSFDGREVIPFNEDELEIKFNPDKTEDVYERLYLTNKGRNVRLIYLKNRKVYIDMVLKQDLDMLLLPENVITKITVDDLPKLEIDKDGVQKINI